MRNLFIILTLFCVSTGTSQQIESIKGWIYYAGQEDSILHIEKKYNKEGQLLKRYQPEIYCIQEYTYDSLERLVYEENSCGETSANGSTEYKYEGNKKITQCYCSGYDYNVVEIFDEKDRILKQEFLGNYMGGMIIKSITSFKYDSDKLIQVDNYAEEYYDTSSYEYKEYNNTDTIVSRGVSTYIYTEFDSLCSMVEVNPETGDTLEYEFNQYDAEKRKISSDVFWFYVNRLRQTWTYNDEDQLIKHTRQRENRSITTTEFIYEDGELVKEIVNDDGSSYPSATYRFYEENLIRKEVEYDRGELYSTIRYLYTFW